jgi:hypothetical protein
MNANLNQQLSGGCIGAPGANERRYIVQGPTYRYKRYLGSLGLNWVKRRDGWLGDLPKSKAWFIRDRLKLVVTEDDTNDGPEEPWFQHGMTPAARARVRWMARQRPPEEEGVRTRWEEYSAQSVHTNRDERVDSERNINERGCYWGSAMCQSCMECVSNIEENGFYPDPDFDVCDDGEENERNNAAMPVA